MTENASIEAFLVDSDTEDTQQATTFFQDIYNEIDRIGDPKRAGYGDEIVTSDEVKQALADPILANKIQKIIGYHPTEWHGKSDDAKWEPLKGWLVGEENRNILEHELERIDKLVFWKDVEELKTNPKVYHFHPIAFIQYINMAVTTYHIYASNKKIEKHVPFTLGEYFSSVYRYVYHDINGNSHNICDVAMHKISLKDNGTRYNADYTSLFSAYIGQNRNVEDNLSETIDEGIITKRITYLHPNISGDVHIYIKHNSGVDLRQRVIRTNGDIYEYGYYKKALAWRKYAVNTTSPGETELIHVPAKGLKITHDNQRIIDFTFHDTARFYANPNLFAGFIGVLGCLDFTPQSTGFAFKYGTCFPSSEHANGASFDFRYFFRNRIEYGLDADEAKRRDNLECQAAKDFYFTKRIVGTAHQSWLLNGSPYRADHDDHFHFGEFDTSKVIVIKE